MVHDVGEGTLEAQPHALGNAEVLGQSRGYCRGSGTDEDANAAISDWLRRNWVEGRRVEHDAFGCYVAVPDAIRSLESSTVGEVEIARVIVRAGGGREIRPCLPKRNRAHGPAADDGFADAVHVGKKR